MRFLSNKCIILILMIISAATLSFLYNNNLIKSNCKNISCIGFTKSEEAKAEDEIDNTIFNLHYKNKVWTFYARDFEIDSNVFSINSRINKYNRNGTREDKIKLINKLINININPEIAFNYIYLGFNNKLNKIEKNINKLPQNAEIKIKNNKLNIKKEIVGIKLNKCLFYNNLIKLYDLGNKIIDINIPVCETKPMVTAEMLKKYTHKRSEFSTSIATSTSGRKYNVRKALNAIDGTHLVKSEKFSFNDCVGRRTEDRGYKNAKIILDGEFVEGVGGGVCQVSSTLYNAVLLAGLNVVKSQKHSQRVGYVKAGFDAMVNYGTSDLVFENNTGGDVYILCAYTNSQITISVYGEALDKVSYDRQYEIVNQVAAGKIDVLYDNEGKYIDKVLYDDESFELKKARDGYTIKSYLVKYVDGNVVDKKLLRVDKYLPQQGVVVYGVQKRPVNCGEYTGN